MKSLTCKEMGGDCDAIIRADTSDLMQKKLVAHIRDKHPETAYQMFGVSPSDYEKWESYLQDAFHRS
ncbi:MAG: DUF1059 domain-containing protein [Candidatus Pacebacteria bacterium]|nr:DUF1059 domain-containing protein [Candidatus Paceibacterota bacterium]